MTWLVILLIAGGIAAWILVALYNRLVRLRNGTANALAQIDVQLKRRYELIPTWWTWHANICSTSLKPCRQ